MQEMFLQLLPTILLPTKPFCLPHILPLRCCVSVCHGCNRFGLMLALVVLMEVAGSPINIIVDAAVMGAGGVRALSSTQGPA